jgi:hypothetical protein
VNSLISRFVTLAVIVSAMCVAASAQRRHTVVVRPAAHPHTRLVVHTGHPIRRVLPTTVVVRPAHRTVVVNRPLVFLPALAWTAAVVSIPPAERLVWQDSETIARDEDWVDTNFGIDATGDALFLDINGKAKMNFAEVTFANGNVQVVDFNEQTKGSGTYKLLNFEDGRRVMTVRLLAKSMSDTTRFAVYLSK